FGGAQQELVEDLAAQGMAVRRRGDAAPDARVATLRAVAEAEDPHPEHRHRVASRERRAHAELVEEGQTRRAQELAARLPAREALPIEHGRPEAAPREALREGAPCRTCTGDDHVEALLFRAHGSVRSFRSAQHIRCPRRTLILFAGAPASPRGPACGRATTSDSTTTTLPSGGIPVAGRSARCT